ncbi:MAG: hypothetical protein AB9861_15835 [Methanosarcina sp.]
MKANYIYLWKLYFIEKSGCNSLSTLSYKISRMRPLTANAMACIRVNPSVLFNANFIQKSDLKVKFTVLYELPDPGNTLSYPRNISLAPQNRI